MITLQRYTPDMQQQWDAFVREARNSTFLFMRGYMDYHADRFSDHSLVYLDEHGKIIGVMPGHSLGDAYYSHRGLTYGGIVCHRKLHLEQLGEMFRITCVYLSEQGFKMWHYKTVPSNFHRSPSEDDRYWLWRLHAWVNRMDMAQCVSLRDDRSTVANSKRNYHNRLLRQGYKVTEGAALSDFWPILESNLMETHNARPVHTLEEMQLLQSRFPNNIVCATVTSPEGKVVAGTVLYITDTVVHTQYISASASGKTGHAMDMLMVHLIDKYRAQPQYRYFDFGTSMESDHIGFNEGLVKQKEEFGAHGIAYPEYVIEL